MAVARGTQSDQPDVAELKALAERQPELSTAVSLQIALLGAVRRVQMRIATPSVPLTTEQMATRLESGSPLLDFEWLGIDWTEARLLMRQVTDILRRHDAIDASAVTRLHDVGRTADLPELARRWFENGHTGSGIDSLEEVLAWALRPFLVRAAEVVHQRAGTFTDDTKNAAPVIGVSRRRTCPVCGGEPDFACITPTAARQLMCGRCPTRWPSDLFACPFCGEAAKDRITSFATPERTYRVTACQSCRRYLKTFDGRHAGRRAIPSVDMIATLPLDAVVMQRGFTND